MSEQPILKLYQLCGQIDEAKREHLRINLDGKEFSYGSDDYVMFQNELIQEGELKERESDRAFVLYASVREAQGKATEREPVYQPEEPRYRHIGV